MDGDDDDDAWEALVSLEDRFVEEGRCEARVVRREKGREEGRQRAQAVGREVGFYRGWARAWCLLLCDSDTPPRTHAALDALLALAEQKEDSLRRLERLRAKYRLVNALLGTSPGVGVDATLF